ncbi:hypothetical protein BJV74DRAFT_856523 [Russula compacta]|nr:hypothetical protein BJV74DRAFT_856523 [Russula compacta]
MAPPTAFPGWITVTVKWWAAICGALHLDLIAACNSGTNHLCADGWCGTSCAISSFHAKCQHAGGLREFGGGEGSQQGWARAIEASARCEGHGHQKGLVYFSSIETRSGTTLTRSFAATTYDTTLQLYRYRSTPAPASATYSTLLFSSRDRHHYY